MIPTVGCHTARALLEAFIDGELNVDDQVLVESHLRGCQTCTARVEDLNLIGSALRVGAWAGQETVADAELLQAAQHDARGRAAAERDQSVGPWLRETFADMRLLWPAIGASVAVAASVGIVFSVLHAASAERPESLAAMIESLADPGSDRNPLRLDNAIMIPRVVGNGIALDQFDEDEEDAVFAVATVVTREGRIGTYELLESAPGEPSGRASARTSVEEVLGAVRHSRFAPAQAPGGRVVAVNMVWLIARTTVKASQQPVDLTVPLSDPSRVVPVERPREPVHAPAVSDAPAEQGSNSPNDSTTA
jgi:hypothetical protein